ncbi:MAG TPA: hypothetical protein VKP08_14710 [Anaerolineales bacterium]|nr:hypothetical protein [Anaerolineales bacterium]
MNENNVGLRIIAALVLLAAVAAIGFFAFQAGIAQGSPVTIKAPSGETAPLPSPYYGYGWGMPFHRPFGFGFGCFGFLIVLFLFFVAMRSMRLLFWGPRWGWGPWGHHHGGHGRWGRWENGVPPMFEEWHKRAHGEAGQPEEKKE